MLHPFPIIQYYLHLILTFRKKFDSLKYDVKKVEEVVYDLSIRGLIKEGGSVKEDKEADKEADKEKEEKEKNAE